MSRKKSTRLEVAERRAAALRLRARGTAYTQIAADLGYASANAASKDVSRALRLTVREAGRELLDLEAERTERLLERAFTLADSDDTRDAVRAIEAATRVLQRRAAMFGIDNTRTGPDPVEGAGLIGKFFAALEVSAPSDTTTE